MMPSVVRKASRVSDQVLLCLLEKTGLLTSCVDCGIVGDPGVERVTHSSVSDCQLEVFVTARHPLPSTTIITLTCRCMWSKNID